VDGQLSLSELNSLVKETLQVTFPEQVWVVAEIGEMKVNRNGHCYLELVEKNTDSEEITARAKATIWSWQFRFIQPYFETSTGQTLTAGLRVLVSVSVEFHEVYGYSLNIKDIDPTYTLGDLARKRMEIIRRLTDEGVIDMNKEIPVPDVPSRIAVISSPTAAGYEDFINQLTNNQAGYCFYTRLFPATMQGNDAAGSMMAALDYIFEFEHLFDVVVIIRGGGSQLDLTCFDDYDLAMHIAQFPLPVFTGIGHEKDDTIADLVANTRLKTPTAVAEFIIGLFDDAASEIEEFESSFFDKVNNLLNDENRRVESAIRILKPLLNSRIERSNHTLQQYSRSVKSLVKEILNLQQFKIIQFSDYLKAECHSYIRIKNSELLSLTNKTSFRSKFGLMNEKQTIDEDERRLVRGVKQILEKQSGKLDLLLKTKQLVDPKTILDRGFSITLKDGKAVKNSNELEEGQQIETILAQGIITSKVNKASPCPSPAYRQAGKGGEFEEVILKKIMK
jgi:exodeoxyribonuclease VII large subunit